MKVGNLVALNCSGGYEVHFLPTMLARGLEPTYSDSIKVFSIYK